MSIEENININNEIDNKSSSINEELNPIVIQLITFGYDNIYSRRVFHYFHPDDLEEALNYMAIENGIIQHRFVKDNRNINNKLCYICGESEEIHLKELNYIHINNNSNNNINHNFENGNNINNNINNISDKQNDIKRIYQNICENIKEIRESDINGIKNESDIQFDNINKNENMIINQLKNFSKSINNDINKKIKDKGNHSLSEVHNSFKNQIGINNINLDISYISPINGQELNNSKNLQTNKEKNEILPKTEKNINNNIIKLLKPIYRLDSFSEISVNKTIQNFSDVEEGFEEEKKMECPICNEEFMANRKNRVQNCGHTFCNGCWYDFLSIKIKENKLPSIKCLDYKCKSKLSDDFIINLLNTDKDLIKKYKKYKMELEVINNPNKKLCPFPNCDSYLELKDIKEQYVTCKNNHSFCFVCSKKPHGNLPCETNIDKSMLEYATNNFVKKCPNCSIITEKKDGCNHITCSKCQYQWCWLCNEKYENDHFEKGKCKGFQFFKPKNEYEIKLMMEGKINSDELSRSQRQVDDFDFIVESRDIDLDDSSFSDNNERRDGTIIDYIPYRSYSIIEEIVCIIFFIFLGNIILITKKYKLYKSIIVFIAYFLLNIAFFFQLIFLNLISMLLMIIFLGMHEFINIINNNDAFYINKTILILVNFFVAIFCPIYTAVKRKLDNENLNKHFFQFITFCPCFIICIIIFIPNILLYNFIYMIIFFIKESSFHHFLIFLDIFFNKVFNFKVMELGNIFQ